MDRKKDLEALATEFEKKWRATRLPEMDTYDLLDLMDYYSRAGMDFEAELCRRAAEQHDADNPEVILTRAHWAADDGDWSTARKERKKSFPSRYDDLLFDVEYFVRSGNLSRADRIVLESLPSAYDLPEYDFLFDCAALFRDFGYVFYALKYLAKIPHNYTDFQQVESLKIECYGLVCQYVDVRKLLNDLLDTNPFDIDLWTQLAGYCFRAGDAAAALDACEYALAIGPADEVTRLSQFIRAQQSENMDTILSGAVLSQDYLTCEDCGDVLYADGQYDKAISCYSYAGLYCPRGHRDREKIVSRLALCQIHSKKYEDAYMQVVSLSALGGEHWGERLEAAQLFLEEGQAAYAVSLLQLTVDSHEMCGARCALVIALLAHYGCYEPALQIWKYLKEQAKVVSPSYLSLLDEAVKRLEL